MKRLLVFLKDYKKECVLAPLFKMLEAIFELFVPLVMASIVDQGIAASDMPHIWKMCLILLLLAVVGLSSSLTAQYFAAKAAVGFSTKLRHSVFEHIGTFSYSQLDRLKTPTLITRMTSDINQAQAGVNMFLRLFLRSPFIVFGAMLMAFTVNAKEALTFVVTIPLLTSIVVGIMALTMPMYKKVQQKLDAILDRTSENLEGVRVIRAFRHEKKELDAFNDENDSLNLMQRKVGRISALLNPVTFIIINAATIVLLYTGALKVDTAVITKGELIALVNYMSQILVELIKLANLIVTISRALACTDRVADILDIKPAMKDGEKTLPEKDPGIPSVEFDHVHLTYLEGSEESLSDISFKVMPGESLGIIGGTGSGKSSLVNLIPRFYDATKGTVKINGTDVRDITLASLRRHIGIVPQNAVLFSGTIADNLRYGKDDATDNEMFEALKTAQAFDFVTADPKKLQRDVTEGGKNLSGGQKQRLTIARALIMDPQILILDDSASALDMATDSKLREALRELNGHPATFIVSQRASSVMNCDRILVMENGQAAALGTHDELLKTCEIYREIYETQFST
ncbi:MAG: ABC transporter ATP-binding protein/permease [Lachnospiraceae bacterium]|nr:ABC transporter ATP-binding protein/permease [Lachnospiraceae bacterium]